MPAKPKQRQYEPGEAIWGVSLVLQEGDSGRKHLMITSHDESGVYNVHHDLVDDPQALARPGQDEVKRFIASHAGNLLMQWLEAVGFGEPF